MGNILMNINDLTLPLNNPVLIFSLILFIILFAPIILNKLKIPYLIGLIIAGVIIGPEGFGFILRDSSIILFGTVGLLYLMFLAGLEMDLEEFKKNKGKSVIFGLYTFILPMVTGLAAGMLILDFSFLTSSLLAAMLASHTLIAYPLISKLGVAKNRAVNITVSGTIITDTLALLVLAIIDGVLGGKSGIEFWLQLSISILIFVCIVLYVFPLIGRWFFKRFNDHISQYIFILGIVFLSAFLAEAAGIEPIIGAFLAGLSMNRLIPETSALMNRIHFVGNALFIPIFLIGVGMLIDYKTFFADFETLKVALTMTILATLSKFIAAWMTQKTFGFSVDERRLIFGLSNARVGATLAIVLIGYNLTVGYTPEGEEVRLINESVLNGTILMILLTCTIASFAAQRGASNLALSGVTHNRPGELQTEERILIPVSYIENTEELINLSIIIKSSQAKRGLYALNVINNDNPDASADEKGKKILNKAASAAAATDHHLHELLRYDFNIMNAINSVVAEHKITDLVLGQHEQSGITDSYLGKLTEGILAKGNCTTFIYKPVQPVSTVQRHVIVVPDKAEKEIGFPFWLMKTWNIANNTSAELVFYSSGQTLEFIKQLFSNQHVKTAFEHFENWKEFGSLTGKMKSNDSLSIVLSRKDGISFHPGMTQIPAILDAYFSATNIMLIYPVQSNTILNRSTMLQEVSMFDTFTAHGFGKIFTGNK